MTLNQLLKQNQSFYGASVIAGGDDLDREVKSVMVLEAADIENWGKPGQLLLTGIGLIRIDNLPDVTAHQVFVLQDEILHHHAEDRYLRHRVKARTADFGYSALHHGLLQLLPYSADHSSQDCPI